MTHSCYLIVLVEKNTVCFCFSNSLIIKHTVAKQMFSILKSEIWITQRQLYVSILVCCFFTPFVLVNLICSRFQVHICINEWEGYVIPFPWKVIFNIDSILFIRLSVENSNLWPDSYQFRFRDFIIWFEFSIFTSSHSTIFQCSLSSLGCMYVFLSITDS